MPKKGSPPALRSRIKVHLGTASSRGGAGSMLGCSLSGPPLNRPLVFKVRSRMEEGHVIHADMTNNSSNGAIRHRGTAGEGHQTPWPNRCLRQDVTRRLRSAGHWDGSKGTG
jgi:hypothetical protein